MGEAAGSHRGKRSARSADLSVVMPVHNALPYLDAAIESILGQSFRDFEFVILDDASTDGSTERLREWAAKDPRIRLIEEETNLGPAKSSDTVARAAFKPIVARMDADDLSHPDRLAQQFEVLERNPDAGLVACLSDLIDSRGRRIRGPDPSRLTRQSLSAPFAHGAIMYRRSLFDAIGGYRADCDYWEDQDLFLRMAAVSKLLVIPRTLYTVRQTATSTRAEANQERMEEAIDRMYRCFDRLKAGDAYRDAIAERAGPAAKLDPRVFVSLGSNSLWAGGRPRLFRRFLRRARLAPDFAAATALAWTAWASASPASLRAFLRLVLRVRNKSAVVGAAPVRWAPPAATAAKTDTRRPFPR